jgi:TonB family protein
MSSRATRFFCAVSSLLLTTGAAAAQNNFTAKVNDAKPVVVEAPRPDNDRVRDGLNGPVRRVRTEIVKVTNLAGKTVEDPKRILLETAEYDVKGSKTQNQYFPMSGSTLTGREVYKYDDKGNISEMTLLNSDGSLLSKESYKYEFDSMTNWVKMTTSVALVGNGKVEFEPTEVTYRTIFYYLDASVAKLVEPAAVSKPVNSDNSTSSNPPLVAALPPRTSLSLKPSTIQPAAMDAKAALADLDKKMTVTVDSEPPAPRPILKPVSGGVLNGRAVSLPAPIYPETARRMRLAGKVEIEVIVDENGRVISARAIAGPVLLREVAVEAAMRARFSPTKLSGQPVKISGRIEYNFMIP